MVVAIIGAVDGYRSVCELRSVLVVAIEWVGGKGYSMLWVTIESKSQHAFDIQARLETSV